MTKTTYALTNSPKPTSSISGRNAESIAEDNLDVADRVEEAIYEACAFVAEAPMHGHCRSDLTRRRCDSGL